MRCKKSVYMEVSGLEHSSVHSMHSACAGPSRGSSSKHTRTYTHRETHRRTWGGGNTQSLWKAWTCHTVEPWGWGEDSPFGKPGLVVRWSRELDAEMLREDAGWLVLGQKSDVTVTILRVTLPLPTAAIWHTCQLRHA